MRKYEKIETIFARDTKGTKKLIEGCYRNETVKMLKDISWRFTEKIDGTNIRVYWDGHEVSFAGRTDKAQIPKELEERLEAIFKTEASEELFEQMFGDSEVILFGEGYGRKIQAVGSSYIPDGVDFILFDVMIGNNYQPWKTVCDVATAFGINTVPLVGCGVLEEAVEIVKKHRTSMIGDCFMEGLVCRPEFELKDRVGNRIIVKIKREDFKHLL